MRPIEEIHAALQRIHAKACDHAAPAYMRVPANPEQDADLIVSDAIAELAALRKRVEELDRMRELLLEARDALVPDNGSIGDRERFEVGQRIDAALRGKGTFKEFNETVSTVPITPPDVLRGKRP